MKKVQQIKKFNVGDKVRLKSEIKAWESIDEIVVFPPMLTDKQFTITNIIKDNCGKDLACMLKETHFIYPLKVLESVSEKIDKQQIEKNFREILIALGENPDREGLKETPKRVAKAYSEIFEGLQYTNKEIAKMYDKGFTDEDIENGTQGFGEFVSVNHIRAYSCCEHHILPMTLDVSVAYIPNKKVLGLSKMPRIVKMVCKRLQLQERINRDIFDVMSEILETEDIIVQITGTHMCMSMRGVEETNSETKTLYCGGKFKEDINLRREFLMNISK